MSTRDTRRESRVTLLRTLRRVGREHSDATVIFHSSIAQRLGLNGTDEKTMSLLEREGPMTAGDIARRTGLATASVTNLVDRLEHKGFVRRIRDAKDRRTVIVEPAPEGVAAFVPCFESTKKSLARLVARYSNEELAVILDFMNRNTERLRKETAALEATTRNTGQPRQAKKV